VKKSLAGRALFIGTTNDLHTLTESMSMMAGEGVGMDFGEKKGSGVNDCAKSQFRCRIKNKIIGSVTVDRCDPFCARTFAL